MAGGDGRAGTGCAPMMPGIAAAIGSSKRPTGAAGYAEAGAGATGASPAIGGASAAVSGFTVGSSLTGALDIAAAL